MLPACHGFINFPLLTEEPENPLQDCHADHQYCSNLGPGSQIANDRFLRQVEQLRCRVFNSSAAGPCVQAE
jgi:hypothetical protein